MEECDTIKTPTPRHGEHRVAEGKARGENPRTGKKGMVLGRKKKYSKRRETPAATAPKWCRNPLHQIREEYSPEYNRSGKSVRAEKLYKGRKDTGAKKRKRAPACSSSCQHVSAEHM